jgi:hypothetical protein
MSASTPAPLPTSRTWAPGSYCGDVERDGGPRSTETVAPGVPFDHTRRAAFGSVVAVGIDSAPVTLSAPQTLSTDSSAPREPAFPTPSRTATTGT